MSDSVYFQREQKNTYNLHFKPQLDNANNYTSTYYNGFQVSMAPNINVKTNRSLSVGVLNKPTLNTNENIYQLSNSRPLFSPPLSYMKLNEIEEQKQPPFMRSQSAIFSDNFNLSNQLTSPISPISSNIELNEYFNTKSVPITRRNSNELLNSLFEKQSSFYIDEPNTHLPTLASRKVSAPVIPLKNGFNSSLGLNLDNKFNDNPYLNNYSGIISPPNGDNKFNPFFKDNSDKFKLNTDNFELEFKSNNNEIKISSLFNPFNNNLNVHDQRPMVRTRSATHFADLYTAKAFNLNNLNNNPNVTLNSNVTNNTPTNVDNNNNLNGLCRFYLQGHCIKANRCQYKHVAKTNVLKNHSPPSISNNNNLFNVEIKNELTNKLSAPVKPVTKLLDKETFMHDPPVDFKLISKDFIPHIGKIASLCLDQHGCRYIQKKLEENKSYQNSIIFQEISIKFHHLIIHPFGNYVCQKLIESCDLQQKNILIKSIKNDLVAVSMNMHGTRAIQKILDFLVLGTNNDCAELIECITSSIKDFVVPLIKDINGNHVIQKCINRLIPKQNQFIYDSVCENVMEVATHRHGCCVFQRCIDYANPKQKQQIIECITNNAFKLVQDAFGNYVVQYILDLNDANYNLMIINQFKGKVCTLSVQKFASNVIEKCIRKADDNIRFQLIQELLSRDRLDLLIRDSYANYVVQTCLEFAKDEQREKLIACIKPLLNSVKGTSYAKRIQSKIHRNQHAVEGNNFSGIKSKSPSTNDTLSSISNERDITYP